MASGQVAFQLSKWAAESMELILSAETYNRLSVEERRDLITSALKFQIPIPQPEARHELISALEALSAGHTMPLLEGVMYSYEV